MFDEVSSSRFQDCVDPLPGERRDRLRALRDQRGITGLETAIVLIAFVVVASVFAFAVLTTGLLSTEKSKEAVLGGLEETESTMVVKGSVVAHKNPASGTVDSIELELATASRTGAGVNLSDSSFIISYIDSDQAVNLAPSAWTVTWLLGSGVVFDPEERVQLSVDLSGLSTPLVGGKKFTLELKPSVGAILVISKRAPVELLTVMNLK